MTGAIHFRRPIRHFRPFRQARRRTIANCFRRPRLRKNSGPSMTRAGPADSSASRNHRRPSTGERSMKSMTMIVATESLSAETTGTRTPDDCLGRKTVLSLMPRILTQPCPKTSRKARSPFERMDQECTVSRRHAERTEPSIGLSRDLWTAESNLSVLESANRRARPIPFRRLLFAPQTWTIHRI